MGKSAPRAPSPPDPVATAAAQTQSNVETATANAWLNAMNQFTPYGSIRYNQTGTQRVGENDVPTFEAISELSPEDQALLDQTRQLGSNAAGIGNTLLGNVSGNLSQPLNYEGAPGLPGSYDQLRSGVYDAQMSRFNQDIGQQEDATRQRLANQGIAEGTEAYGAAQDALNRQRVDASNQAYINAGNQATQAYQTDLSRRQQGIQEISALRNAPINEISGLFGLGPGVQNPQFTQGGLNANVQPTDVIGAHNNAYQQQLAAYQMQNQSQAAGKGGAAGALGSLGGAAITRWSDRRLKRDIRRVGTLDNGLPVYLYRMLGSEAPQLGVMADEVAALKPEAVKDFGGFLAVDYAKAVEA